jgi:hypothetical protein
MSSSSSSWLLMWTQHVLLAREYMHEALTRREGGDSAPALVVAERARTLARSMGTSAGGGIVGRALESALRQLTDEFLGFVAATAQPPPRDAASRSADVRLVAYTRAGTALAEALAYAAQHRRVRARPGARVDAAVAADVDGRVVAPFVAALAASAIKYHAREYADSYTLYDQALTHVVEVLGPFTAELVPLVSDTQRAIVALLRSLPSARDESEETSDE